MKTFFAHFRNNLPRPTTVAYQVGDDGGVIYNYAECSRRDNFCKRIGRQVAEGRLNKGGLYLAQPHNNTHKSIIEAIANDLSNA